MKVFSVRGRVKFGFNKPLVYFAVGRRGTGKSTLLEHIAQKYLEHGACILDLYGSLDGEAIGWLRSPYAEEKRFLLLKGQNVDVTCSHDVKLCENLKLEDFNHYDIIISTRPLYLSKDHEYFNIAKITDKLYRRRKYKRLIALLAREAASLWYSRVRASEVQTNVKSEMIYLLRELRHTGTALLLDSLRYFSVDVDIRELCDFLILKGQGITSLPFDLKFLYSFFDPHWIRRMKPWEFLAVCGEGQLGVGYFPFHKWHKREKEDILANCGVTVEYGEELKLPENKGPYQSVGDEEHVKIVEAYAFEGSGMLEIAEKQNRSTRTISVHIKKHNGAVTRSGFCPVCRRAGSECQNDMVARGSKKEEKNSKHRGKVEITV